jgi:BirA family biotin operon repressor/biotin-[acetyl-CoA-carboxylase] ligase
MEAAFRVLEVLENADGPVSGEYISNELSISRSAVWKHVKELLAIGYDIRFPDRRVPPDQEK